jgi:hypothetical protein
MKIKPEDYAELERGFYAVMSTDILSAYQGMSQTRMLFDVFHIINKNTRYTLTGKLYQYLNDNNLEAALKKCFNGWQKDRCEDANQIR